jgi:hypothetical protein
MKFEVVLKVLEEVCPDFEFELDNHHQIIIYTNLTPVNSTGDLHHSGAEVRNMTDEDFN